MQLESLIQNPYTFPVLECFHIAGFGLAIGTIALADFRMLGLGISQQTSSEISRALNPWTMFGFVLIFLSGAGLFASDPDMYYLNRAFQFKMLVLLIALIFHFTTHQSKNAQWVAALSLLLWAAVVFGGIFIGFSGEAIPQ